MAGGLPHERTMRAYYESSWILARSGRIVCTLDARRRIILSEYYGWDGNNIASQSAQNAMQTTCACDRGLLLGCEPVGIHALSLLSSVRARHALHEVCRRYTTQRRTCPNRDGQRNSEVSYRKWPLKGLQAHLLQPAAVLAGTEGCRKFCKMARC